MNPKLERFIQGLNKLSEETGLILDIDPSGGVEIIQKENYEVLCYVRYEKNLNGYEVNLYE
jgi:hypothetical protein